MKVNHLILTFAAAATLAACSSELDIPTVTDDTQTVTFTAQLPGGLGRSYGDGTTATNLIYAVYDEAGNLLPNLGGSETFQNLSTDVYITLNNGKTYNIVFWASADGSPYSFDPVTATITADYSNAVVFDERLDAFTKTITITPKSSESSVDILTLTRPFAQLNIGTNDIELAWKAGYSAGLIAVTVKDVGTTLNLLSGAVGGNQDVTFGYDTYGLFSAFTSNLDFPVSGYRYLAMDYVLVGGENTTTDVSISVYGGSGTANMFTNVPLKANYRTNIFGTLLTTKSSYNVSIDPTFQNDDKK